VFGPQDDLEACYRALDLAPGASAEDVKTAWRDLVKIWHPDRFAGDPRLQQRCQEKIKQINKAYDVLKGYTGENGYAPAIYRPEQPQLRCAACGRVLPPGERECYWCNQDTGMPAASLARDRTAWRWTMTGLGTIAVAAVLFHFAFEGLQNTFAYLFVLLVSFAFLRQVYHTMR